LALFIVLYRTMSGSSSISKPFPPAVSRVAEAWIGRELTINAPSKLNLRLKVEGRRDDGYHLLSMINCSTSRQDTLRLVFTADTECVVTTKPEGIIPQGDRENLVILAFRAFWREFGLDAVPFGFRCQIKKNIPIGGGLGGGSADAAAMLRHLESVFGAALTESFGVTSEDVRDRVMRAALSCGADVPYAVEGGLCWVGGVGEEVVSLRSHALPRTEKALIMIPPRPVPTAAFYDRFRRERPTIAATPDHIGRAFIASDSVDLASLVENDFESTACAMVPEIGEGLAVAREVFPRGTALTGSGSVFFSLVSEGEEPRADELSARLRERGIESYLCFLIFS
jgi:4-diphosphocytidyl-2-C-methyl-D-erythritol kinase